MSTFFVDNATFRYKIDVYEGHSKSLKPHSERRTIAELFVTTQFDL